MHQIASLQKETEVYYRFSAIRTILISVSICFLLYKLFFHFSQQIWGYNFQIDQMTLTPSIRQWVAEKDGIEAYVLYLFSFIGMGIAFFISVLDNKIAASPFSNLGEFPLPKLSLLLSLLCLIATDLYYRGVGLHPPMAMIAQGQQLAIAFLEVITLLLLFRAAMRLSRTWSYLAIMVAFLPICFIATREISLVDYSFIFSPALRMLNHFKLEEIYFQYDLLMPMLAAIWMKIGYSLNDFQFIPRIAMFLFLLGMFFYANRVFEKPQYIFIVALILIRIYSLPNDFVTSAQITSLRLDLWLILLLISFEKGIYSKWLGFSLGLMNVIHHSFGLFYTMAYLQIGVTLFAIDYLNHVTKKNSSFSTIFKQHLRLISPNLMLLSIGMLVYYLLFGHFSSEGVRIYKKLGVGFLRVSSISFYWYVLALLCATFALLMQLRKNLSVKYFQTNLFLLFLGVANSLYFLGRSHEWNILNISGSLILIFFLLLDLFKKKEILDNKSRYSNNKNWLIKLIPIIFIFTVTFYYSERISTSIKTQATNLLHGQLEYPIAKNASDQKIISQTKLERERRIFNIDKLKLLTNNSQKIYVLSYLYDFYYYYYGNYIPRGHFQPYYAWISKKDLVNYLQNLLDNGFYLVIPQNDVINSNQSLADWEIQGHREILSALTYKHNLEKDGFKLVWK